MTLPVKTEVTLWLPIQRSEAIREMQEVGVRYGIKYADILAAVDAGNVVKVSLDHVSEGAVRNGISYHCAYTGVTARCSLAADRRHILIYRPGTLP